jgi:cobalt-zinc-cadmium resistance protein CzcA
VQVPVDAFPDVTPNQVNIYTESPGSPPRTSSGCSPFRSKRRWPACRGRGDRSVSLFGLSYVGVYFKDNVDIYFARRLVGEKLQEVKGRLPEGYGEPELGPNSSGWARCSGTRRVADKKLAPWTCAPAGLDRAADPAHRAGRG